MKIALYMHGGSGNHGCEALVRTVSTMVAKFGEVSVFSKEPSEDKKYIETKTNKPINLYLYSILDEKIICID